MKPAFDVQGALQAGYTQQEIDKYMGVKAPKPKVGGIKGALLNFLPTIGAAGGAALGTVAAPVVGTAAGGAAGGALGEYLRQRLTGEAEDGIDKGNLVQEGLFGAVPGVLKGAKLLKGASSLAKAGKTIDTATDIAKAGKAVQSGEAALMARKGILGKIANKADDLRATVSNTRTGTIIERGKRVTPKVEDSLNTYLNKTIGATGSPKEKLVKVLADKEDVGATIGKLAKADKTPIMLEDLKRITSKVKPGLIKNAPETDLVKATREAIAASPTKGELHTIKGQLDDELKNFYRKVDAGTATKSEEKILKAYRDGIKEVLGDIPGYKEANKTYSTILDAEKLLLKAPKPRNISVFGVDTGIGGEAIQKTQDKVGRIAQKVVGDGTPPTTSATSGFRPFLSATAKNVPGQVAGRVAGMTGGIPFVGSPQQEAPIDESMNFQEDIIADAPEDTTQMGAFQDAGRVEQAYFEALQSGNTKTADAILKGYEIFGGSGKSAKPMSAEASKVVTNAQAGLEAIASLKSTIESDPGALTKTAIPGRGLFSGAVGSALGTGSIDADRQQIIDVIARLRTGAAISKQEEARFTQFIPQAFDSPEVQAQKLGYLERQFARVAQRSGGTSTDLEASVQGL